MLDDNPVDDSTTTTPTSTGSAAPTEGSPDTALPADDAAAPPVAAPAKKAAAKRAPAKKAAAKKTPAKKATTKKATAAPAAEQPALDLPAAADPVADVPGEATAPPAKKAVKRAPAKRTTTRKVAARKTDPVADQTPGAGEQSPQVAPDAAAAQAPSAATETLVSEAVSTEAAAGDGPAGTAVLFQAPRVTQTTRRSRKAAAPAPDRVAPAAQVAQDEAPEGRAATGADDVDLAAAPTVTTTTRRSRSRKAAAPAPAPAVEDADEVDEVDETGAVSTDLAAAPVDERPTDKAAESAEDAEDAEDTSDTEDTDGDEGGTGRRRRRRGGRRRRKSGDGSGDDSDEQDSGTDKGQQENRQQSNRQQGQKQQDRGQQEKGQPGQKQQDQKQQDQSGNGPESNRDADDDQGEGSSRRRRRRRRTGDDGPEGSDDPDNTVTRVRKQRNAEDEITAISGSTRLEAKKQRRRDGREAGRRRAPIVSEAEFLARREAVDRVMVIRQSKELTQIAVLEDKVLVEHYVARESQTSIIGNVYLGRVQNVLPSMEAAFIDIGKGRNAVLYAGEVNWSALGHKDGQSRKIESVLSSGQSVLVQVTKDPIGHKGARLTSQVSLAGRFLVYVPDGTTSGISRKLPDTERARLKALLKEIVPESAGVIVRTAAEGASEDELTRDVERLKARWEVIESKVKGSSPQLLYGEPDLTLKVVRDLFTEDFTKLVIEGDDAWETVQGYVEHVAPDLADRLERFDPSTANGKDSFAAHRVEEQIAKGLDRKVWLPSGGSLVIDRTEAMTVVDVNTGKFTGSGGNLEETVTKNNLEAAEEMVRQLRLRDIGGIIVIDFIDMVLESNRDLVLRRLVECLGRDRTRHQVAEVTSLGLVQMTRKRIGTGLVEAFSENCAHCQGRGVVIQDTPVDPGNGEDDSRRGGGSSRGGDSSGRGGEGGASGGRRGRGGRGRGQDGNDQSDSGSDRGSDRGSERGSDRGRDSGGDAPVKPAPSPTYVAAVARPGNAQQAPLDEQAPETPAPETPAPAPETEVPEAPEAPVVEAPASDATGTPDEPQVVTRTRRRSSRGPVTPPVAEPVVEADAGVESGPQSGPDPVEAPAPGGDEPAGQEPKPQVVTRTRRRSTSGPVTPPVTAPVVPPVEEPAPAPSDASAPEPAEPEKPKVVTRTRGRSSAGPR